MTVNQSVFVSNYLYDPLRNLIHIDIKIDRIPWIDSIAPIFIAGDKRKP
jgi:hypothetical protein